MKNRPATDHVTAAVALLCAGALTTAGTGQAQDPTAEARRPPPASSAAEADWPSFKGTLSGEQEVRVRNPNEFSVKVGLRSAGKGKDFDVPANGVRSVYVPDGAYDIYFRYSTEPDGLYQGDSFRLDGHGVEIQIVKVVNGNYGIRKVK